MIEFMRLAVRFGLNFDLVVLRSCAKQKDSSQSHLQISEPLGSEPDDQIFDLPAFIVGNVAAIDHKDHGLLRLLLSR